MFDANAAADSDRSAVFDASAAADSDRPVVFDANTAADSDRSAVFDASAAAHSESVFALARTPMTNSTRPTKHLRPVVAKSFSEVNIMSNSFIATPSVTINPSAIVADQLPDPVVGDFDDVVLHRAAATQIARADVIRCTIDVRLAVYNAGNARDAIVGARDAIEASRFPLQWEHVDSLDSLSRALVYMTGRVSATPRNSKELSAQLKVGRPLRKLMLAHARAAAIAGRCPAAEVKRIVQGRGTLDTANDLVDLAALHTQYRLVGETVTDAQVTLAMQVGTSLRTLIRPVGAQLAVPLTTTRREALDLRDRLWTIYLQRYRMMERAGGAVWGGELRKHVPALLARFVARKKTAPAT